MKNLEHKTVFHHFFFQIENEDNNEAVAPLASLESTSEFQSLKSTD